MDRKIPIVKKCMAFILHIWQFMKENFHIIYIVFIYSYICLNCEIYFSKKISQDIIDTFV